MSTMLDANPLAQVARPFKTFFERLAGPEGPQWLEAFKRFLRKENPWPKFSVFMTVTLGTHKSVDKLRSALEVAGFRIGDYAGQILAKISLSSKKVQLDLAVVSGADLGFTGDARRDAIYTRALELGYQLCPAEVGPALRLAYPDQPSGEWLLIAMEPITDSDGNPKVFFVGHDCDDRWLYGYDGEPDHVWGPGLRWVFVVPRK